MHFEKNKSVICNWVLFIATQTSSSSREGIRELNSKISLLRLQSIDLLHQTPWHSKEMGNT